MRIESLTPHARRVGRHVLCFEDGSRLTVGLEQVADFGLRAGLALDADTHAALIAATRTAEANARAAAMLARRPLTRHLLVQKLLEKGIEAEYAAAAADRMTDLGYLDDGAYANLLAESFERRGYGRRRLEAELRRRGVDKSLWPDPENEDEEKTAAAVDAFLQGKLRGSAPDEGDRRRLSAALERRGYDWSDISAAWRRLKSEE